MFFVLIALLRSEELVDEMDGRQVEGKRGLGIMPWPCIDASWLLHQRGWREQLWGAMTDVALTTLMVGIAASHLRMHRRESNDRNDRDDRNDGSSLNREGGLPWTVLVDAAASAVDLVLARGALTMDNHFDNDNVCAAVIGGADGASDDALEGSLLVLNKETAQGRPLTVLNGEVERWNVVMHLFRIALKLVGLAMGRLILLKVLISLPSSSLSSPEEKEEEEEGGGEWSREEGSRQLKKEVQD